MKKSMQIKQTFLHTLVLPLLLMAFLAAAMFYGLPHFAAPTTAKAANAENEFVGSIFVYSVMDYNNAKCLKVAIPSSQSFGYYDWSLSEVTITATTVDNGGATYTKNYSHLSSSYIPLTDIGAFTVYGNYQITAIAKYQYTGDGTYADCSDTYTFVHEKKTYPLPITPTQEGYTFAGWYYDKELTRPYDGLPIYEPTSFYAKFTINRYTVVLDSTGGILLDSLTVEWNTAATLPTPERTGYNFVGWFLRDGTQYTNQPIKAYTALTAKWEPKIITVTFCVPGKEDLIIQIPYGSSLAEAMAEADVTSYMAMDVESGERVSKYSVMTENTAVLITELTGWEKFGDYVAQNQWFTWTVIGVVGALIIAVISMAFAFKKRG